MCLYVGTNNNKKNSFQQQWPPCATRKGVRKKRKHTKKINSPLLLIHTSRFSSSLQTSLSVLVLTQQQKQRRWQFGIRMVIYRTHTQNKNVVDERSLTTDDDETHTHTHCALSKAMKRFGCLEIIFWGASLVMAPTTILFCFSASR